jgi:hypothetical protein
MRKHIMSIQSSRTILNGWAHDWCEWYGEQELIHVEEIGIGGKKNWNSGYYDGEQRQYLMVAFPNVMHLDRFEQRWVLVDDIEEWQKENDCNIKEMNHRHLMANKEKWLVEVDAIESEKLGHQPYIKPIEVDESREGYYGAYNNRGKLLYIVYMTKENMFAFFDKVKRWANNFSLGEMVDNGYVSVKSHMSWLGQNGKNVHAVEAYHRVIGDEIVYFSLQTWCSGNHWKSIEHSPIVKYPNSEEVTCKKCLKKMERKAKMESAK